jgi:hypothetical protein
METTTILIIVILLVAAVVLAVALTNYFTEKGIKPAPTPVPGTPVIYSTVKGEVKTIPFREAYIDKQIITGDNFNPVDKNFIWLSSSYMYIDNNNYNFDYIYDGVKNGWLLFILNPYLLRRLGH